MLEGSWYLLATYIIAVLITLLIIPLKGLIGL